MTDVTLAYSWAPITKKAKQDDGSLLVYGPVASDALDRDLQVCDPAWLAEAVPEWFGTSGNVREMHSNNAVGRALSYDPTDHSIVAHIVDPVAVAKCEANVLQGFSIGIKRPKVVHDVNAPGGRIVGGQVCEVSVVDRPSNPTTLFRVAKSDTADTMVVVESPEVEQVVEVIADASQESVSEALDMVAADGAVPPPDRPAEVATTLAEAMDKITEQQVDPVAQAEAVIADAVSAAATTQLPGLPAWADPAVLDARWATLQEKALAGVKADTADTGKASTAEGLAAFRSIATMLVSEVSSLAAGEFGEGYDADLLLSCLASLRAFIANEASEEPDEGTSSDAAADLPRDIMPGGVAQPMVSLNDTPDSTKSDEEVTDAPAAATLDTAEMVKSALADPTVLATLVEALTAPMTKAATEAVSPLAERLAKVEALPVAGGPVRMRTAGEQGKADSADRLALLDTAADYAVKADETDDPILATGYRTLAVQARERAARL